MTINELEFPRLRELGYEIKSDPDTGYNCIAWAAGENHRWWDPVPGRYWPVGVTRAYSIEALAQAYATLGFVNCDDATHEPGIQKIALFGMPEEYLHAARQLRNGLWTSKLGPDDDIRHASPDSLVSDAYGSVLRIMCRPYPDEHVLGDE